MLAACQGMNATPGASPPDRLGGALGATLTVVNSTGADPSTIFYYVIGQDINNGNRWSYLKPDGNVAACVDGTDFSLQLSSTNNLPLPQFSGRIYFSIGAKLTIHISGGNPFFPIGWAPGNPYYTLTPFDWIEYTFNAGGLNCNTTMVDMFGLALTMALDGSRGTQTVGMSPGGRPALFTAMNANASFKPLIVTNGGTNVRAIAPGHGIEDGIFPSSFLDAYISQCWTHYQTNTLTISDGFPSKIPSYSGTVSGGTFNFTPAGGGSPTISISLPTSKDVFLCNGALLAPTNDLGRITAVLGAALNRANLLLSANQPDITLSDFYTIDTSNKYSLYLHQNNLNGNCYGFPFDDIGNLYSSDVADSAPSKLTVAVGAL